MSVRAECVQKLQAILEEGVFFKALKSDFKPQDTAFANFLILTALRKKATFDKIIASYLKKNIKHKNRVLKYVLLLGVTEILCAQTPVYAVINEYVGIAKKLTDKFSGGMVNAVLREVAEKKDLPDISGAFPESFKEILRQDYNRDEIEKMEQMLDFEAPVDLSVKENPPLWAEKLNGVLFENGTVRLHDLKTNLALLEGYEDGAWWVQDLSASLPVCFLKDIHKKEVLDLCAAPGGKTAQLLAKGAFVTAVDVNKQRLSVLEENIARLKMNAHLNVVCADGEDYLKNTSKNFDVILLDAPCSATGTFRKHPEVLYLKTKQDVENQVLIQSALLDSAAEKLKKNGILMYCTCSLSKDEGEKQMHSFLEKHPNFTIEEFQMADLHMYEGQKLDERMVDKKVLRTLPYDMKNEGGADGFFAVALKRVK